MDIVSPIYDYILKGGFVIFPIILTSIIMWALIFTRLLWFRDVSKNDISIEEVNEILLSGKTEIKGSGLKSFLLKKFLGKKTGNYKLDSRIIDEAVLTLKKHLHRHIALITVLAAISPLFGLLGTVTGMIDTFDVITFFGTGNPRAMAAGISEALVTTQTGLLVAIPGMFMSVIIARKAKRAEDSVLETAMLIKRKIK